MQVTLADDVKVAVFPDQNAENGFFEVCRDNPELRVEQKSTGEIIIMPPAGNESSNRNSEIIRQLANWTRQDGRGKAFDSNTIFVFPDSSKLGPDAAWVSKSRLSAFPVLQRKRFLPVVPEFIIELRSQTDRLPDLHEKMLDWIRNGVVLGWLIDADARQVWIFKAGNPTAQVLSAPPAIQGTGPVAGFELAMDDVYEGLNF